MFIDDYSKAESTSYLCVTHVENETNKNKEKCSYPNTTLVEKCTETNQRFGSHHSRSGTKSNWAYAGRGGGMV